MNASSAPSKVPFKYRMLRTCMPILEKFSPTLIGKIGARMFLTPLRFPIPEKEEHLRSLAEQSHFKSGNTDVYGYIWGKENNGKKILLMHGWASRASHFTSLIETAVENGDTVYAIDAPGHGQSQGKQSDVIQFAQAILDWEQRVGKFDIGIGHSMGGTALLYAMTRGLSLQHLCLLAVPAVESEIIKVYCDKLNISEAAGQRIINTLEKRFQAPFKKYTASYLAESISPQSVALFFDRNDKEVSEKNAQVLHDKLTQSKLFWVESYGHAKMLGDNILAKQILDNARESVKEMEELI
ncbi:alpha/beta hydrolase [Luteibaculum oceani]|uniref:Alpha/beta fold hydrolase n=1 Tax=Luteibaculum oceani TaxID=1294296 RepID=A0A5C6V0Q7_9FLAO|nr:alpha/beta fold hydrolase [Luteibaculum oceani]TXC78524.1 alpha/beta fold hydrolase [Luteibaculum oceani]